MNSPLALSATRVFRRGVVCTAMEMIGRALQLASRHDPEIRREIEALPQSLTIQLKVLPKGPQMTIRREEDHFRYLGNRPQQSDLAIEFKSLASGYLLFSMQLGINRAIAEHRIRVLGDPALAMVFIRCLDLLQERLLPGFLKRRIMRPQSPTSRNKRSAGTRPCLRGIPSGR